MEPFADSDPGSRAHLRDLVALLALPAVWSGREPAHIVGALLDVLASMLRLEVVYLRATDSSGAERVEAVRVAGRPELSDRARDLGAGLEPWLTGPDANRSPRMPHPVTGQPLNATRVPLGVLGRSGAVLAASSRPDFPTPAEAFLLRSATNQAEVALQNAELLVALRESHRVKDEALRREQASRTDAEAANRAKDEFLATLSHELRTPLNAILGWTQVARSRTTDPETLRRALETIERNAKHQTQLVEDLLDLSRIVAGKLRLEMRPVDLVGVIAAALETVRPTAEAKGLALESHLDPAAGTVLGDADRLQQVVWNLVSNAVKFTPRGGRIEVRLEQTNSRARIVVSDTGEGIDPSALPFVFDRFRQADSTLTRPHSGLGLGLAIVRHLVELHGGTVAVTSAGKGQGTRFSVMLPLRPMRAGAAVFAAGAGSQPRCDGLRILVVDDEPDSRDLLVAFLSDCGAEVRAAPSAGSALTMLQADHFDVVITDLAMPGEDGFTLVRRIRALPDDRTRRVPVVALTAHAGAEIRVRTLVAGFTSYLAKPVEPVELVAVVSAVAGRPPAG